MVAEQEKRATPGGACARLLRRMRQPTALCLPVARKPRVFAGGRTPECLMRALRKPVHAPRKLARLCGWTEKPPTRPHLVESTLLGSCLSDLVRFEPKENRQADAATPQRASLAPAPDSLRPASLEGTGKGTSPARAERPQPWSSHPALRPGLSGSRSLSLPEAVQAPVGLLTRRAGNLRQLNVKPKSAGESSRPTHRSWRGRAAARQPSALSTLSPTEWVNRLSRRLIQQLWRHSPPQAMRAGETQPLAGMTWVERSLALLPSGPQAPQELLHRLAGESTPVAVPESSSNTGGPAQPDLLRSPAERSHSGAPAWDAPFSSTPRQAAPAPASLIPTGAQQGFYPQAGSLPLPAAGQPNFRPLVAPPLAADTPPTLLAPQEVYDAPTPYAAAALRREALEDEEALVQEDLELLAGKIKRILDEEARRFGIPG